MVTSSSQPVSSKFFSNRTTFPVLPVLHNPSSWLGTWLYLPRLSNQHFIRQAHGFGDSPLSNEPIDQSVKSSQLWVQVQV
ncbi:hypothetical protein EUGRSUZ_B01864 [Eucalyptus grandis]|uniref:Uncharacterized protein n=2 Tax=Eucalyptus grandis TaxID=71139 RepID=A0ACC3LR40_EUCGR|nr:hypothetical protein EUGRSUZ_B01864 [Eucalyptus grandis]